MILLSMFGIWGFYGGSAVNNPPADAGDVGLIPGLRRFPWRRERLPTPVFWPGEFHGLHSLWGREESDTTERLFQFFCLHGLGHAAHGSFHFDE